MTMRIRSVSTAVVEANFDWTILRLELADGTVGWGESFFAPGLTAIIKTLAPLVLGADIRDHARILARLRDATSGAGSVGGIIHNALSGIDAAMWDAHARLLGVPLWELLGGRFRDVIRVYADCHGGAGLMSLGPVLDIRVPRWLEAGRVASGTAGAVLFDVGAETEPVDLASLRARAAAAVSEGFGALKFDLDVPGLVPVHPGSRTAPAGAADLARQIVGAVRDGAGPAVELAFDLHWRYDLPSAARIAEALSGEPVAWLEDPLPPDNIAGLLALSARSSTPLGGGENLVGYRAFEPLIEAHALSVVTPDLGKVGGVDQARRIAEAAAGNGIAIAPHNIAGPVGTAFAAQVSATFPNMLSLEHHAIDVPFFSSLVAEPLICDGAIAMTDRPGIGVTVNEDVVREWAKPGEDVFGDA